VPPDLSFLPDDLKAVAVFTTNKEEVMWARHHVERVIAEVADSGHVVLGLDLRSDGLGFTPPGLATEVPWSIYDGEADPAAARDAALAALRRRDIESFDEYRWVLVTWR